MLSEIEKILASRIARSNIAIGRLSHGEIVDRIMSRLSKTLLGDKSIVSRIVTQMYDSGYEAGSMRTDPTGRPTARDLPIDWSLADLGSKYGYTVRVTWYDANTGAYKDALIRVASDTILTYNEVSARAQQVIESGYALSDYISPGQVGRAVGITGYTIIGAGRVPM